jgi:hypothetical protein
MLESDREEQLLKAMLLLKEESQQLVRRHREVVEQFDLVIHELNLIRTGRQKERGHDFSQEFESSTLPTQKRGEHLPEDRPQLSSVQSLGVTDSNNGRRSSPGAPCPAAVRKNRRFSRHD